MTGAIDLNADLGEGCGDDAGLMAVISSASIACGGHAGDETSMRAALLLAKDHSVAVGAHPSYPDRENFGRRSIDIDPGVLGASLRGQIRALKELADEAGVPLVHVKPHGALYNDAAVDGVLAREVVAAIRDEAPGAAVMGPPDSCLADAAAEAGLGFIAEGFADRAYTPEGRLVQRGTPGAVIEDEGARISQALAFARGDAIEDVDGNALSLGVETICLHGDSPGALASAKAIRAALEVANIAIRRTAK